MTVKMLIGIAGTNFALSPGDETSRFSPAEELRLIKSGHALRLAAKTEKAVKPVSPETR